MFDLLGVRILHGWLIDPQAQQPHPACSVSDQCTPQDVATTLAINNMAYNQALELLVSAQDSEEQNTVRSFLNGPQLTYFGLAELHRELADGQSVVLFRENHFSVVYKHRGQLYTLVTAEGYLEARGVSN